MARNFNTYAIVNKKPVAQVDYVPTTERTDIPKSKIEVIPFGVATSRKVNINRRYKKD